jgi:aspartyl-tRNA(Asn)/glutamyl-tRNA(Gln) amidotransferase subunit C
MSLSTDDVKRIARLARIEIDDAQAQATQGPLNTLFGLITAMQAVNTTGIEPMAHAQEVFQRLRADTVTEVDRRDALQAIAPADENGLYLVPRVVE